jgi:predicted RNA-binding protein YlqC (UPF0109 family)
METDQAFVEYVVKAMVDHPEDVSVDRTVDEMGVLITLKVNQEDLGQIIGRQGQTAKSLRTLLRVVGAKNHARVNMKIYEPEGARKLHQEAVAQAHAAQPQEAVTSAAPVDTGMGDDLKI